MENQNQQTRQRTGWQWQQAKKVPKKVISKILLVSFERVVSFETLFKIEFNKNI